MKHILLYSFIAFLICSCGGNQGRKHGGTSSPTEDTVDESSVPITKPTVNVYIENSGSMDGYVNGITEFEQAVYNYLVDIKISGITDSLNLYYINSTVIPQGSDINDFIEKLEPSSFIAKGGNRGISDISNVFKTILSETDRNDIAIFVTDGIFSPGRGKNAEQYLVNQQIGIKNSTADFLKQNPNTAVVVYQLSSNFDGMYYNRDDKPEQINTQRPFYIWIIGDLQHIAQIKAFVPESSFKGSGIQHSFTQLPSLQQEITDYAILNSPKYGSFDRDKKSPKTSIYNIERAKNGEHKDNFMITVGMDFSLFKILLGEEYLLNTNNYNRLIKKETNDTIWFGEMNIFPNTTSGTKHTHNLQILFKHDSKIPSDTLVVALINRMPQWVSEVNDDEGLTPVADKTFGIKYLVEGIYDAYIQKGNKNYTTMKFNLKK